MSDVKKIRYSKKCIHGKSKNGYNCIDCPGKGICCHKKRKSRCSQCGGKGICCHKKRKSRCSQCGGKELCKHNRLKNQCIDCHGVSICLHNVRKSFCNDCNGNQICIHKIRKNQCKICHGSQICSHDRIKSQCNDCRKTLPIDVCLKKYKEACVICGKKLYTLACKLERLCGEHRKDFPKRVEIYFREMLEEQLGFPASLKDQTVCTTDSCYNSKKYRPDIVFITTYIVFVYELDEQSHSDRSESCELARLIDIKDAFPDNKVLVIRVNPDKCKVIPKILKPLDAKVLAASYVMEYFTREENKNRLLPEVTNVIYMFYDNLGSKHITNASNAKESIHIIKTIYCE
jgi:hypothetical protein